MLRLILWNDAETSQHTIELYDTMPVNLTYQFSDITEISKPIGSYSQTFRIPATKLNTDFFGAIYDANVFTDATGLINGNYNIKKKIRAELVYNSVPLMVGFVQVKSVFVQKESFADIELVFLAETLDLTTSIGSDKLSDLDTTLTAVPSKLDHLMTYTQVTQSFDLNLQGGNVVYGFMDKGRNWSFQDSANPAWSPTQGIYQADLTPYVRAKWLVDAIITTAGYTYDSVFFDSVEFNKMYLPAYNGSLTVRTDEDSAETQVAAVGLTSDFVLLTTYQVVPMVDSSSGAYDYVDNWNNTTHKYIAPYSCTLTYTINIGANSPNIRTKVWQKLGSTPYTASIILDENSVGQHTRTINVQNGDELYVETRMTSVTSLVAGPISSSASMWFRVDSISEPLGGATISVSSNFPDIKQIDFLLSLQKLFNLIIVADKKAPKHLIIEPFVDYLAAGTTKDWTNKIDYKKDVVIKSTADIQATIYDWNYTAGQDFLNVLIQQSTGRVYGRYRVIDNDNDFTTANKKTTTSFSPYTLSNIPGSTFPIFRNIDQDGSGVKEPTANLTYYNGWTFDIGTWYIQNDSNVTVPYTRFPYFSNYNSMSPSVGDNDLNYGYERAFIAIDSHPINTSYHRYWMPYVNELYSSEARLLTAYVKLTRADIQAFEFSDKIYIRNAYYRVLKIANYDATTGGVVRVDFIKVLSDIADCDTIPTGQNSTGEITFDNSSTNYGNQTCCERYGYIWINRKVGANQCFPTTMQSTP